MTNRLPKPRRFSPLALAMLAFVVILVCFIAWNLGAPAHDPQIEAIRRQGYPVTLKELDQWYQRPPDAENAALIYTNAFAKMSAASNVFDRISGWTPPARGEPIATEDMQEFNALLATNRDPLALLDSAVALPKSRYPVDLTTGPNFELLHVASAKWGVKILVVRASLETAGSDSEAATRSFLSAGHLTGSLTQEPFLLSQLVECASWAQVAKRLEWSLNAGNFSATQLERLQNMFARAESNAFYLGLVGERVCGYSVFSDAKSQATLLAPNAFAAPAPRDQLKARLLMDGLKATGIFQKDKSFYLRTMSNSIAIARLPFPERLTAGQSIPYVPPRSFYIVSSILLPAIGKSFTRDATRCATIRVTATALAIERFRCLNSNSLPENLGQLVPAYLPSVPADPFDGKPLRFKQRGRGYVVYSVGSDLQDDGGAERDPKKTGVRSDVTFILDH